ncbi:nitroreductase family protein, partial [archaeon]|nr:nitroreductase family protein [archaeon]
DKDTAIAVEHIVLAAAAKGLGTCWIGSFNEQKVRELVGAPEHLQVVALLALGYPAEEPPPRPRKPLTEIAFIEKYGQPFAPPADPRKDRCKS